ncbi:hypothetical protein [Staphylococcus aureus]|uniref:hypothetical protein n=1 Tax=Staphylococcus aureus TaxID=1280 RepID=UPI0035A8DFD7
MTQLTLPIETSVRIPQNDISRYVNEIVETIPDSEFDEFRHHRGATSGSRRRRGGMGRRKADMVRV